MAVVLTAFLGYQNIRI